MRTTLILSLVIMLGVFGMIFFAVVLIQEKKLFSSAPKDIQAAILPRPERFPGARALGYAGMGLCVLCCGAALIYAGYDGIRGDFALQQFLFRYLIMLYLYLAFDIGFLDWFLLTESGFYQHFYPETIGCAGYHSFGFNRREKLLTAVAIAPVSLVLALICTALK